MCLRIAKIHQETITQELGNVSVKTLDDFCAHLLIRTDNFPKLLRVELSREGRGAHQVTEHDRQLAALCLRGRRCRWGCGHRRWRDGLGGTRWSWQCRSMVG